MEKHSLSDSCAVASAVLVSFLALCSATGTRAQAAKCAQTQNSPGDASLRLTLKNGQSVFHQGEIIALTVEYSADSTNKYVASTANYDRSGRLSGTEIFCIEPERGTDPLDDYFHSLPGIMGGGLSSEQDPAHRPLTMDLELNEWKSLPPGSYRLTIIGNRLRLGHESDSATWQNSIIPLRSNTVEFEIRSADPEWQASQLRNATQTLDSPDASQVDQRHAARVLRFLGSEGSARELARRYGALDIPFEWDFKFGLYGTPYREVAIQAMKAELSDPDHPVTRDYVSTLVALEMLSDPKLKLPPYEADHQEQWRRASDAHWAEVERRINGYMQQASAAPRDAAAQGTMASEMLQSDLPLSSAEKAHWRQVLVSNWSTLPIQRRNELIEYRWEEVGGPEWLPVLQQIVAGPSNPSRAINQPNRGSALLRIVQIAPEDAGPLLLREIGAPQADIGIDILGLLPEHTLPQFEVGWLKEIRQGGAPDVVYQLLDRYGSEHVLPLLQQIYEDQRGQWACIPQTAMLRYFLRIKPNYGVDELAAALVSRQATGCYRTQLSGLGDYVRMPQVQKLAVQQLNDSVPSVASDAAKALHLYGALESEDALWRRLEKFHEQWKDQPDELLHPRPNMIVFDKDSGLEQALVQSILSGQAWFADAAAIGRLKELSSPAMQNSLDSALQSLSVGEFRVDMRWWPKDELNYTLGWYSGEGMTGFREKLAQFPPGSHFKMVTTKALLEAHQAEIDEAKRVASANGELIEIDAPR